MWYTLIVQDQPTIMVVETHLNTTNVKFTVTSRVNPPHLKCLMSPKDYVRKSALHQYNADGEYWRFSSHLTITIEDLTINF